MDYGKLSKDTLIEMCEAKGLSYSSSMTKAKLEELLIASENAAKPAASSNNSSNEEFVEQGPATIGKVGAILLMVYLGFWLIVGIFMALMLFGMVLLMISALVNGEIGAFTYFGFMGLLSLVPLVFSIIGFLVTIPYLKGTAGSKVPAGILGILCWLLPGIFIFVSEYTPIEKGE